MTEKGTTETAETGKSGYVAVDTQHEKVWR